MIVITVSEIKEHSRIDATDQDTYLEHIGEVAETLVSNMIRRPWDDIFSTYGSVPEPLHHACLMMADHLYEHRGVTTPAVVNVVPVGINALVKPYVKLVH